MAIHGATGLRGNANRLPAFARHEDRLNLRGLCDSFTGLATDRKKIPDRSIHGRKPANNARWRDAPSLRRGETLAKGGRDVGHGGKIKTTLGIKRMVKLRGAKRPLAERRRKLAQFFRRFPQKFNGHVLAP